jgi:hypothetical protein
MMVTLTWVMNGKQIMLINKLMRDTSSNLSHDIHTKIRRKTEKKEDSILIVIALVASKQFFVVFRHS